MAEEQRRFPRVAFEREFSYRTAGSEAIRQGKTVDMSAGGLCVAVGEELPLDELVQMELSIPTFNGVIVARGVVMWGRKSGAERGGQSYQAGIQFTKVPESQLKALQDFVLRRIRVTDHTRETEQEQEKKRPVIMVVDDNGDERNVLKRIFEPVFDVVLAANGFDAVMLANEKMPQAITLDLRMTNLDGLDTLALLKNSQNTKNIPVIMITVIKERTKVVMAQRGGASGYITKPFSPPALLAKVASIAVKR